ncbi:COG3650 family protein [Croceicoccus hydrothermalis]|uniref:COG3650 family protein n=1 Tax=Croceicoccus hydrothermalis TaxID=2867964 RepID=UPI001EFBD412|nr:hypothetical protein [Croceicoccus hydrothermalis]
MSNTSTPCVPRPVRAGIAIPLLAAIALAGCQSGGDTPDGAPGDRNDNRPFSGIAENDTLHFTGTEPFWNGEVVGGVLTYTVPADDGVSETAIAVDRFAGRNGISFSGVLNGQSLTLAATPGACNDGMSDRTYPFSVTLQLGDETRLGCGWTGAEGFTGPE